MGDLGRSTEAYQRYRSFCNQEERSTETAFSLAWTSSKKEKERKILELEKELSILHCTKTGKDRYSVATSISREIEAVKTSTMSTRVRIKMSSPPTTSVLK